MSRKVASAPVPGVTEKHSEESLAAIYSQLAGTSSRMRLMDRVVPFSAVTTRYTGFNRATGIGGHPLSGVAIFHGPSAGGKTALLMEIVRSVQEVGGPAMFVDAEEAAETKTWFRALGVRPDRCLYLGRVAPEEVVNKKVEPLTFELVVDEVKGFIDRFRTLRREKKLPMNTPAIIGVDSLSKLIPKRFLDQFNDDGGEALGKGVGRLQAQLNTAWLLALGPLIGDDNIAFVGIAHEYEQAGNGFTGGAPKIRGGDAQIYDSMLVARVSFAGRVTDAAEAKKEDGESAERAPMVGKCHRVVISKNKHAAVREMAYFYTSNGTGLAPLGADLIREMVHEGLLAGVFEGPKTSGKGAVPKLTSGSVIGWGKGKSATLARLYRNDKLAADLREMVVAATAPKKESAP